MPELQPKKEEPKKEQPKETPKQAPEKSGPKVGDISVGQRGNWKTVSVEDDKIRVENQESYDIIFVAKKDNKWSYRLLNKDNKKVNISSPNFEKLLNAVIKIYDNGGKIVDIANEGVSKMKRSELKQIVKEEVQKLIKENSLDDYSSEFQDYASKLLKGKKIEGWTFSRDNLSGTFEFDAGDWVIVATPLWDGNPNIPIDVVRQEDGDTVFEDFIHFKPTMEMKKDFAIYIKSIVLYFRRLKGQLKKY